MINQIPVIYQTSTQETIILLPNIRFLIETT